MLLFSIAAVVILFVVLELTLRAVVSISVGYISKRQDITFEYKLWQMHLFDSFMGMNEPDPQLFWRLKPGYKSDFISIDSDGFAGPEIKPKQANEFRIFFLGDSTPLGLGLPKANLTFVRQLQTMLQQQLPDKTVTVINGSVAGYTSWQCRKQLELDGDRLHPDMVITYFGNNDPSINGYLTDEELYRQTSHSGWLNRLLAHSYIYQLLKGVVLGLKPTPTGEKTLTPRVPLAQAKENLEFIYHWCRSRNVSLVLCTVPTPDLWPPGIEFKIFTTGRDSEGRLVMASRMQQDLEQHWSLCLDTLLLPGRSDEWTQQVYQTAYRDLGDPGRVAELYADQLKASPDDPRLLNNFAVARWYAGQSSDSILARVATMTPANPVPFYNRGIVDYRSVRDSAKVYLDSAKQLDNYSLRIKKGYNDLYLSFAKSHSLVLANVDSLFNGLPENEYFIDHCHPTEVGHSLIAHFLTDLLRGRLITTK